MKQFFGKKSRNALTMVLLVSLALHVVAILIFGTIKFVTEALRKETVFEAVPIEPPAQRANEYKVNLEQRNKTTPPPEPPTIVVNNPSELAIPSLDIDVNVDSSSVFGRAGGGFSGGALDDLREMSMNIEFFGSSFTGDTSRMMFVIDMSGSMIMDGRGVKGYKNVVDEVVKTLEQVASQGSFNIIAFAGDVETFRGSFTRISNSAVEDAKKWMMKRDPAASVGGAVPRNWRAFPSRHQGTSSGKALEVAFDKRPRVIIFLSDGEPTDKSPEEIYKIVEKFQGSGKVPINTVSYKMKSEFMETLAKRNDGAYTHVR